MAWTGLESVGNVTLEVLLTYPLTGDYYFYAKIFFAIWVILTSIFYFEERNRVGRSNFLSAAAVSSFAVLMLAFVGSTFNIITGDILAAILVICLVIIFVWYVKKD